MNPLIIGLVAFACVFGAALFALLLRPVLPQHHLNEESRDVVRAVTGMIATLAAMVLGLLVASAKNSYDTINAEFRRTASEIILVDRVLGQYGLETREVRELMRRAYAAKIEQIFSTDVAERSKLVAPQDADAVEDVETMIRQLAPKNDTQRGLQSRALQIIGELAQAHWLLVEQAGSSIPVPFLAVLVSWLAAIFASFGLFARRNATALTTLFIGALAVSTSILLIEDLDQPFTGLLRMSSAPMRSALTHLGH